MGTNSGILKQTRQVGKKSNGTNSKERFADPNNPKLRNDYKGATKILQMNAGVRDMDSIPNNTIS